MISGAYPIIDYPRVLIDISDVPEIRGYLYDQNLIVGAGTTLSEFIEILREASDSEYFGYLRIVNEHLDLVAHRAVRNVSRHYNIIYLLKTGIDFVESRN